MFCYSSLPDVIDVYCFLEKFPTSPKLIKDSPFINFCFLVIIDGNSFRM